MRTQKNINQIRELLGHVNLWSDQILEHAFVQTFMSMPPVQSIF